MSENNTVTKDNQTQAKQRPNNSTRRDYGPPLPLPDLLDLHSNGSTANSDFPSLSNTTPRTIPILGSQPTVSTSVEIRNALELTFEEWKYIFGTCNLDKALFINDLKPKFSYESVIHLKENVKPKVIVEDSSTLDACLTYTERSKSFVENKFSQTGISFSCPFVSIKTNYEENERLARTSSKKKLFTTCMWNFPRVNIELDSYSIEPTSQFLDEVDNILNLPLEDQYDKFEELFSKYGHVIATEFTLGGQLYHTDMQEREGSIDETQHVEEQKKAFEAAVKQVPVVAGVGIDVTAGAGVGSGNETRSRREDDQQIIHTTFQATGGKTTLCQNPGAWASTVENFRNWRVINIEKTVPVYQILDKKRQQKINSVLVYQKSIQREKTKWKQQGITIAGGNGLGNQLNQLWYPHGIFIDNDKTIYIADGWNHRIVQWKFGENKGQVIAGGNGRGNRNDQLSYPRDLIVDKQNNSLIIAGQGNRRVMRWSRQNKTNQQILISDIDCYGLTMDKNGFIYVCDAEKNEVRRWKEGETKGTIVAGGNGEGNNLNQLNKPSFIFVDEDYSLYISDTNNHRVMKWRKDAREGIVVAGGNDQGTSLKQLSFPYGVTVDHLGQIYVADRYNQRVMRWCEGSVEGSIVIGGNGEGEQSNQLCHPIDLSFDAEGNLYVSDSDNHRIQKFDVIFS